MQPTSATSTGSAPSGAAPGEGHTARSVDQSLSGLRLHAVEMGGLVIDQVARATEALLGRDAVLAESVLSREPLVNDYDTRLDEDSLTFIALQQPVANDLRMTRAIARSALELERAGDEAKKIARFAVRIGAGTGHDPVVAVARPTEPQAVRKAIFRLRSRPAWISRSSASAAYHLSVKPRQTLGIGESLKEYSTSATIGRYRKTKPAASQPRANQRLKAALVPDLTGAAPGLRPGTY